MVHQRIHEEKEDIAKAGKKLVKKSKKILKNDSPPPTSRAERMQKRLVRQWIQFKPENEHNNNSLEAVPMELEKPKNSIADQVEIGQSGSSKGDLISKDVFVLIKNMCTRTYRLSW